MSDENNVQDVENQEALDLDFSVCCPDADAPAEPYHAIMMIGEDGKADGNLWGQGTQLMLFDDTTIALKIIELLGNPAYQLRGVTKEHLEVLKKLEESGRADLFVIIGYTAGGKIEAMPLKEHQARMTKAGIPPKLPKHC